MCAREGKRERNQAFSDSVIKVVVSCSALFKLRTDNKYSLLSFAVDHHQSLFSPQKSLSYCDVHAMEVNTGEFRIQIKMHFFFFLILLVLYSRFLILPLLGFPSIYTSLLLKHVHPLFDAKFCRVLNTTKLIWLILHTILFPDVFNFCANPKNFRRKNSVTKDMNSLR